MKKTNKIIAKLATALMTLAAFESWSSIILKYEGVFTVTDALGVFNPFAGMSGEFAFLIDYSKPDADSNPYDGPVPNAVVAQGFIIGGKSFIDTSPTDLRVVTESGGVFMGGFSSPVTAAGISDITIGFSNTTLLSRFVENPLIGYTGQWGPFFSTIAFREDDLKIYGIHDGGLLYGSGQFTGTSIYNSDIPLFGDPSAGNPPPNAVPSPASLPLMATGLFGCGMFVRRGRKKSRASTSQ